MKRETHEYLRAHRSPGRVPGEFIDSLPDVEGTLEEAMEAAREEGWQRFQEKYGDAATELTRHDQAHGHYQEEQ